MRLLGRLALLRREGNPTLGGLATGKNSQCHEIFTRGANVTLAMPQSTAGHASFVRDRRPTPHDTSGVNHAKPRNPCAAQGFQRVPV